MFHSFHTEKLKRLMSMALALVLAASFSFIPAPASAAAAGDSAPAAVDEGDLIAGAAASADAVEVDGEDVKLASGTTVIKSKSAGKAFTSDSEKDLNQDYLEFFRDCSYDYGYQKLGEMENGANLQKLYDAVLAVEKKFFAGSKDMQYSSVGDVDGDGKNDYYAILAKVKYSSYFPDYNVKKASDEEKDQIIDQLFMILDYIQCDYPLIYFNSSEMLYDNKSFYIIGEESFASTSYRNKINNALKSTVESTKKIVGADDYATAENVHDFLINKAEYAFQEDGETPVDNEYVHSAAGFVVGDRELVCDGFSKTYSAILNYLGIDTLVIEGFGNVANDEEPTADSGHAWNAVKLNNWWFFTDVTFDENASQVGEDGNTHWIYRGYEAKGTETFYEDHCIRTFITLGDDGSMLYFCYELPENMSESDYTDVDWNSEETGASGDAGEEDTEAAGGQTAASGDVKGPESTKGSTEADMDTEETGDSDAGDTASESGASTAEAEPAEDETDSRTTETPRGTTTVKTPAASSEDNTEAAEAEESTEAEPAAASTAGTPAPAAEEPDKEDAAEEDDLSEADANPTPTRVSKVKRLKKGFRINVKPVYDADGYQLRFGRKKSMTGVRWFTTTSLTVKKQKKKTKYYYQVRSYKIVNGQKVFSSWSKRKTLRTK